ncbi:hypothetical protein L6452_03871 [Arctium lappa]|uniref:Uncharacterized protein n=1 Tax=Arctium lappa TaxID=4217 RepID=A0ACB9FN34_ARCLA|nr:hypothetical protein L6452_03871 [Arctium lappa]
MNSMELYECMIILVHMIDAIVNVFVSANANFKSSFLHYRAGKYSSRSFLLSHIVLASTIQKSKLPMENCFSS